MPDGCSCGPLTKVLKEGHDVSCPNMRSWEEARGKALRSIRIPHNSWRNRPECEDAALRVLHSGHVAQGVEVEAFERELAERFRPGGMAACVSSGSAALYLALEHLNMYGVKIPTYSCVSLLNAVNLRTGTATLLDCAPDTLGSSNADIVVHTYGIPEKATGAKVEDFTHAVGASVVGLPCGSFGTLSVISFGATKPLGIGAGGAVLGSEEAIRAIRDRRDYDTSSTVKAFNWQMSDLHAAIGRERLSLLDAENAWRRKTAEAYQKANKSIPGPLMTEGRVFYRYVIRLNNPEKAQQHFTERGIETIVPLKTEELLHRRLGLSPSEFPHAEQAAKTTLSLPIWPGMSESQVDRVCEALTELHA